jgi:hypothetical protein
MEFGDDDAVYAAQRNVDYDASTNQGTNSCDPSVFCC